MTPPKKRQGPTKPPPIEVSSDDFELEVDETVYQPHLGETVTAHIGVTVGDYGLMRALDELKVKLAEIKGDDDEGVRQVVLMDESYGQTIEFVRPRLVSWTWTDDNGEPMPQPGEDPLIFNRLKLEELFYLTSVLRGQTAGTAKNGSRPSQTTSSASEPQPSQT